MIVEHKGLIMGIYSYVAMSYKIPSQRVRVAID
jgi:hypothetical protein